jgi:hypothetical protein
MWTECNWFRSVHLFADVNTELKLSIFIKVGEFVDYLSEYEAQFLKNYISRC